jgi:hypothetical protein
MFAGYRVFAGNGRKLATLSHTRSIKETRGNNMRKLKIVLLAATAAGSLATTAAAFPASDLSGQGAVPLQQARVYCDGGACVLTRRHARHWYRAHGYYGYPRAYGYYGWR